MSIVCAFELGRRRAREESPARFTIGSSKDVYQFCSHLMMDIPHEEMYVILLNRANVIIGSLKVSQGGISAAVVDIRLILKPAIESLASGIILVHNHPSGNLNPSREDKQITTRLKEAAKLMDISLLDHLIIAGKLWFSFADEGIL
jgi:DNA repair protein RadC